jgi:hypothetical protein
MSIEQLSLPDIGLPTTDAGYVIETHLSQSDGNRSHHAACDDCGRQITVSPRSGIERGHDTECEHQGRKAGEKR